MANVNDRICIIGGGPAGLACAVFLEKKGYSNYVIYEKLNKVGGKAYSPKIEANGEKRAYETGAIMGAVTYHAVSEMEAFGGYYHKGPNFKPGEPNMRREYRSVTGEKIEPFDIHADKSLKKTIGLLKLKMQFKKLKKLMETKYVGYDCYGHIGIAEGKYSGISKIVKAPDGSNKGQAYPNYIEGVNPNLKDLALPFKEFCELNKVPEVQRIWIAPFTSFGYGYFDEIPASYVLKYLDMTTAAEFVGLRLWTWQDGTQEIYESVNRKLKNPAVLQTEVVKVERPDGKVNVTVKDKDGNETTETFDKLIITTPLDYFKDYADASADEKELFSKIIHEKYVDFIARFKQDSGPVISGYIFENMEPERLGHAMVYYHRWEDFGKNCPCTVYALRNHTGDPDVPYDKTLELMKNDIEKALKFPIEEVLYAQESYYCPHVSSKDFRDGWYDKLEKIQGVNNTYYAGEILSFGDMEDTCAASKDIIGRFF